MTTGLGCFDATRHDHHLGRDHIVVRPVVEIESLSKSYGPKRGIDDVSLEIQEGEIACILGPNGAGKTTLVEICEGYRKPDSGTVRVLSEPPSSRSIRPKVGVMLQEGGIYPTLRVGEVTSLFASYYDQPLDPVHVLQTVGLADERSQTVRYLSGGQKQRLSLALALVGDPQVAFLDEPTASMDPEAREATDRAIRGIADKGGTVIFTTHLVGEVAELCDRVAILNEGELVAWGAPSELAGPPRIQFSSSSGIDIAALSSHLGHEVASTAENRYLVESHPTPELLARLTEWLSSRGVLVGNLSTAGESLEATYARIISR